MNKYAMFWGCTISNRLPHLELADRLVLARLGVDWTELEGTVCCPEPTGLRGVSGELWTGLSAYNLSLAAGTGRDIITPCTGCFESLKMASCALKDGAELPAELKPLLGPRREHIERVGVKHLVQVLYEDVGVEALRNLTGERLRGLKVLAHPGCHLLRPSKDLAFDDPEEPTHLDELVAATGATPVDYSRKGFCCGFPLSFVDRELSLRIAGEKLALAREVGVDCMVMICPSCTLQYEFNQAQTERIRGEEYRMPVLSYSELLYLAMGGQPEELGLDYHRVDVSPLLARLAG